LGQESDIDLYVVEFTRSGFRGPLAWYRNVDRSWELLAPFAGAAVTIPTLYIAGDRDFVATANSQFIAKQSASHGSQAPAGDHAGGLRSLDRARTCAGGQRCHDRFGACRRRRERRHRGTTTWLGELGATYWIPIIYVPVLMITHVVAFYLRVERVGQPVRNASDHPKQET
jgi:hypothetical protein